MTHNETCPVYLCDGGGWIDAMTGKVVSCPKCDQSKPLKLVVPDDDRAGPCMGWPTVADARAALAQVRSNTASS